MEQVEEIMMRLHRSTHMHFMRSTSRHSPNSNLQKPGRGRRQLVDKIFSSKEGMETISQVAERLKDLVAKRKLQKTHRRKKDKQPKSVQPFADKAQYIRSIPSSSLDDSDYMGDASAFSSIIQSNKESQTIKEEFHLWPDNKNSLWFVHSSKLVCTNF